MSYYTGEETAAALAAGILLSTLRDGPAELQLLQNFLRKAIAAETAIDCARIERERLSAGFESERKHLRSECLRLQLEAADSSTAKQEAQQQLMQLQAQLRALLEKYEAAARVKS